MAVLAEARTLIRRLSAVPESSGLGSEDARFLSYGVLGALCTGIMHFGFILLFLLVGVPVLALVNVASVSAYFVIVWTLRSGRFELALSLACAELVVHQFFCVLVIGWAAGFQFYVLAVPVVVFSLPGRKALRYFLCLASGLAFVAAFFVSRTALPLVALPERTLDLLFAMNVAGLVFVDSFLGYAYSQATRRVEKKLKSEQEKSEALLLNILPRTIAGRLKDRRGVIADGYKSASVLFADIVDFCLLSGRLSPAELVRLLDDIFCRFDEIVEGLGLEKIKTIGDAYRAASGIPEPDSRHSSLIADCALAMMASIKEFNAARGLDFRIRIGIESGPVVAGVIGKKKFIYDLWGDTVNSASRMESHGIAGEIQAGPAIHARLSTYYAFEDRGEIAVKGKGTMRVWLLKGYKGDRP
jgi:class 3 adenylate cyclase